MQRSDDEPAFPIAVNGEGLSFGTVVGTSGFDWKLTVVNLSLRLLGKAVPSNFFRANEVPVLHAHGLVPTEKAALTPENFRREGDLSHLSIAGETTQDGKTYLIIRETNQSGLANEWWIDPTRSCAIIRAIGYWKGDVAESLDVEYQENKRGWFPRSWKRAVFEDGPNPAETVEISVQAIHFDEALSDADFTVEALPGMVVYDADSQRRYIKGAPDSPDVPITPGKVELKSARTSSLRSAMFWGNLVVLLAAIGAWYLWNRRTKIG